MSTSEHAHFSPDVKEKFAKKLTSVVEVIKQGRQSLLLSERMKYMVELDRSTHSSSKSPLLQAVSANESFRDLLNYARSEKTIWTVILLSTDSARAMSDETRSDPWCTSFFEEMLLRISVNLALESTNLKKGTSELRGLEATLEELIAFLEMRVVNRLVTVPLLNVDITSDSMAIAGFGELRKLSVAQSSTHSAASAGLNFSIETAHFISAGLFPLWTEIRKRVTLMRICVYPLIGYNHFGVQFFEPWESPLVDSMFSVRFIGGHADQPKVPTVQLNPGHADEIRSLAESMSEFDWRRVTPWRLAADRLDDAVFKLQCGSADAILDVVIGLEALLTESESRQESTHKVAVRAARYLEKEGQGRREVFRRVKQAYRARSALAHGQIWQMDSNRVGEVNMAARILARLLGSMASRHQWELDLTDLDLS